MNSGVWTYSKGSLRGQMGTSMVELYIDTAFVFESITDRNHATDQLEAMLQGKSTGWLTLHLDSDYETKVLLDNNMLTLQVHGGGTNKVAIEADSQAARSLLADIFASARWP
jgi:hypothetical protein